MLIDFALYLPFFFAYIWAAGALDSNHPHYVLSPQVEAAVFCASFAFVTLGVECPMTVFLGRTVGKCVFGIKVAERSPDSIFKARALFRTLFKSFYVSVGYTLPTILTWYPTAGQIRDSGFAPAHYPEAWIPYIKPIVQTGEFRIAVVVFNIAMLALLLGLHRKDRLGIHDQIVGTRLVLRRREC